MSLNERVRKIEKTLAGQDLKIKVVSSDGSIHTASALEALKSVFNTEESKYDAVMISAADVGNKDAVDFANLLNAFIEE